jgi:hypothetical protein
MTRLAPYLRDVLVSVARVGIIEFHRSNGKQKAPVSGRGFLLDSVFSAQVEHACEASSI